MVSLVQTINNDLHHANERRRYGLAPCTGMHGAALLAAFQGSARA